MPEVEFPYAIDIFSNHLNRRGVGRACKGLKAGTLIEQDALEFEQRICAGQKLQRCNFAAPVDAQESGPRTPSILTFGIAAI